MKGKRVIISFIIGYAGVVLGLCCVVAFHRFVLMSLPLIARMVSMIFTYWLIAVVPIIPIITILINKEKLSDYGVTNEKIGYRIITGVWIALAMSLVLTLIPHLTGFGVYVDSGNRYHNIWQYIYEFFYCIMTIGIVEEFVFRGFIYMKIKEISQKEIIAVIGSSVLFGLFHLFTGNIAQMFMTTLIGAFFCLCRLKIKSCTTISLILAHGLYDALVTVWASVLL